MKPYIVRQGDYLTKLAYVRGFDADAVWNDPKNEDVKKLRPDRDVLAPGDIVYVPDKPDGDGLAIQKGTENGYAAEVPKIEVSLVLQDEAGQPIANEPYELLGLGDPVPGTTGDDGSVTVAVPLVAREVSLALPQRGLVYPVGVGDLDPLAEGSGVRQRLAHLGHLGSAADADRSAVADAIAAFQAAAGIDGTGALDDATLDALKKAHGS